MDASTRQSEPAQTKIMNHDLSSDPTMQQVQIDLIDVPDADDDKHLDMKLVAGIGDSLLRSKQMAPVFVHLQADGRMLLHKGRHRYHAAIRKGINQLWAVIFPLEYTVEQVQASVLDHEIIRSHSWVKLGRNLLAYKKLYLQANPMADHGKKTKDADPSQSFRDHLVNDLGLKPSIKNLLTTVENLSDDILTELERHDLPQSAGDGLRKHSKTKDNVDLQHQVIKSMVKSRSKQGRGRRPKLSVATFVDQIRREERQAECDACVFSHDDAKVIHGEVTEKAAITAHGEDKGFQLADGSVDAVITDPLYTKDKQWTYEAAARLTAKKMKCNGFALFYCGRSYRREVERILARHLDVMELVTLTHRKNYGRVAGSMYSNEVKYLILCRRKGSDVEPHETIPGIVYGAGQESGDHEYQQAASDLTESGLINAITNAGDLVVDFFSGSGTTGEACVLTKRRCILIEEHEDDCAKCHKRIEEAFEERERIECEKEMRRIPSVPFTYSNVDKDDSDGITVGYVPPSTGDERDDYDTSPEALKPLLPHLDRRATYFEPFFGRGALYHEMIKQGLVIESCPEWTPDLQPPANSVIITNPPYSIKNQVLEWAYQTGHPFIMLLPTHALGGNERVSLFQQYGLDILLMGERIRFCKGRDASLAPRYHSIWMGRGVLPQPLTFAP